MGTKRQSKKILKRYNAGRPIPAANLLKAEQDDMKLADGANFLAQQRLRELHAKVLRAQAALMQARAERALARVAAYDAHLRLVRAHDLAELRKVGRGY